jgi:hypothetical protein
MNVTVLGSQDELTCSHDLTDLSRGDLLSTMTAWSTGVNSGLASRNEGRVKLNLQPSTDPEADKLTVPSAMTLLDLLGK